MFDLRSQNNKEFLSSTFLAGRTKQTKCSSFELSSIYPASMERARLHLSTTAAFSKLQQITKTTILGVLPGAHMY